VFLTFYSQCRIWGEVKTATPQLAQARLGLILATQPLLHLLLQDLLGVPAPLEL
jgi:arginyl-tRNA synthetase